MFLTCLMYIYHTHIIVIINQFKSKIKILIVFQILNKFKMEFVGIISILKHMCTYSCYENENKMKIFKTN